MCRKPAWARSLPSPSRPFYWWGDFPACWNVKPFSFLGSARLPAPKLVFPASKDWQDGSTWPCLTAGLCQLPAHHHAAVPSPVPSPWRGTAQEPALMPLPLWCSLWTAAGGAGSHFMLMLMETARIKGPIRPVWMKNPTGDGCTW